MQTTGGSVEAPRRMQMDTGGLNWVLIDIVGAGALLLALLYAVSRTKSRGKADSSPETEECTREVFRDVEAERRREEP